MGAGEVLMVGDSYSEDIVPEARLGDEVGGQAQRL